MAEMRPKQLVVFSYHFWRIDWNLDAAPAREARRQVQAAIERLHNWLDVPSPFIVEPLRPSWEGLLEETIWYRTETPTVASPTDLRKAGRADCRSVGGTVSLTIATQLNAPTDGETAATMSPAHWNESPAPPFLGSQTMWGANFDADLASGTSSTESLSTVAFGALRTSIWHTWRDVSAGQVEIASTEPDANRSRIIVVLSGTMQNSQAAATVLANRLLPAAARYRARARDVYDHLYRGPLEERLKLNSELLASYRLPSQRRDVLDKQVSELAERLADYGQAYAELQGHRQSIRIDRENFDALLRRNGLPDAGWFREAHQEIQIAARQIEADAGYADIQFRRGQSLMTSMSTRAEIMRAAIEQEENDLSTRRNLLLTGIGLILGLGQIIDRDTGKEFVAWLNGWIGGALATQGATLFVARAGLVVVLSAVFFAVGWLLWWIARRTYFSSSAETD
jgi:hypothetical protein